MTVIPSGRRRDRGAQDEEEAIAVRPINISCTGLGPDNLLTAHSSHALPACWAFTQLTTSTFLDDVEVVDKTRRNGICIVQYGLDIGEDFVGQGPCGAESAALWPL